MLFKANAIICFPEENNKRASLRLFKEGELFRFVFTVETPFLYRMGDERDNKSFLIVDNKRIAFTYLSVLESEVDNVTLSSELLENNNKRTRYRITITIPTVVTSFDAIVEDLKLSDL